MAQLPARVTRFLERVRDKSDPLRILAVHAALLLDEGKARAARVRAKQATLPASVVHHAQVRRDEEREVEEVGAATWAACLYRTRVDHRAREACEACHRQRPLEPHHLELGAGGRRDAPEVVMAVCRDCHTLAPDSAHRAPRRFAQTVVVPWLRAHGYPTPNRKEYR